jgi:hypothetical protein
MSKILFLGGRQEAVSLTLHRHIWRRLVGTTSRSTNIPRTVSTSRTCERSGMFFLSAANLSYSARSCFGALTERSASPFHFPATSFFRRRIFGRQKVPFCSPTCLATRPIVWHGFSTASAGRDADSTRTTGIRTTGMSLPSSVGLLITAFWWLRSNPMAAAAIQKQSMMAFSGILERTADRSEDLLSMTATLNPKVSLALVSGRSAGSR